MSGFELMNPSTLFLMPGIGFAASDLTKFGFISAFVADKDHDLHYDRPVYLLFKPADLTRMQTFIRQERRRRDQAFKEDYDYAGGYVVLAYSFPERWKADYEHFLLGEYSKFSKEYQHEFPEFSDIKAEDGNTRTTASITMRIFNKAISLKNYLEDKLDITLGTDQEYWSAPDLKGTDLLDMDKISGYSPD